jgi:hypothetical protein
MMMLDTGSARKDFAVPPSPSHRGSIARQLALSLKRSILDPGLRLDRPHRPLKAFADDVEALRRRHDAAELQCQAARKGAESLDNHPIADPEQIERTGKRR